MSARPRPKSTPAPLLPLAPPRMNRTQLEALVQMLKGCLANELVNSKGERLARRNLSACLERAHETIAQQADRIAELEGKLRDRSTR